MAVNQSMSTISPLKGFTCAGDRATNVRKLIRSFLSVPTADTACDQVIHRSLAVGAGLEIGRQHR